MDRKSSGAQEQLKLLRSELNELRIELKLRVPLADVQSTSFPRILADAVRLEIEATTKGSASLMSSKFGRPSRQLPISETSRWGVAGRCHRRPALRSPIRRVISTTWSTVRSTHGKPSPGSPRQTVKRLAANRFDRADGNHRVTWHRGSSVPADYKLKVRDVETGRWINVDDSRDRLPRLDDMRPADAIELDGVTPIHVERLMTLIGKIRHQESELRRL